jgi:hypothetical protein
VNVFLFCLQSVQQPRFRLSDVFLVTKIPTAHSNIVAMVDVVEAGCDRLLDTAEDSAAQTIFGQVAEEALQHV